MSDKNISIGIPGDLPITITFVPEKDTARTLPAVTNQQLLNAIAKAGRALGYADNWYSWLAQRANLDLVTARSSLYAGPSLEELNWSEQERAAVKLALGL